MTNTKPVLVLGAGGHAKVVIDALQAMEAEILGAVDADPATHGSSVLGVPVLGGDELVQGRAPNDVALVNAVGSVRPASRRNDLYRHFREKGYSFFSVIHPSAIIGGDVDIAEGVQVLAGAVIHPGCRIGANAVINFHTSLDHDCVIGAHAHIAPGAGLSGGVTIGDDGFIGAGATVIQYTCVGAGALVAAGATVVKDVPEGVRVAGVPARKMP